MRDFIQELKDDHRVIQQVVAGMSAVAELLDSGKQVDPSVLADLVQFLRVFADHCHHEKEEQHLFPLLATKANVSTRRELESLEREHRSAKQLVGQLAKVAAVYVDNPAAVRYRVIDLLQQLAELYPAHIWKEDFLLFPLAQQTLSTTEQEALHEKFEDVEREVGEEPLLCTLERQQKWIRLYRFRAERRTTPPTSLALIRGWTPASLQVFPEDDCVVVLSVVRAVEQGYSAVSSGLQNRFEAFFVPASARSETMVELCPLLGIVTEPTQVVINEGL